jgi:hypothetical protein
MIAETLAETRRVAEILPTEVREWYLKYAKSTWRSIDAMIYPQTGLPADHLHYHSKDKKPTKTSRVDKTSPTDIGFLLACVGAAKAMGFIPSSEANTRIDLTLTTIENMMKDPDVFFPTDDGKGLFTNWIQPSTSEVLRYWPGSEMPVKQQVSTIDNAWLMAFSKLLSVQFPQFSNRIQHFLDLFDLPFMFNSQTGFFRGCYTLRPPGFEDWHYDVISEERITYLVCGEKIARRMSDLLNRRSPRSTFVDPTGQIGRATWDGQWFQLGWPHLLIPEDELNPQWGNTYHATVQMQREFGIQHNCGHYGFSAGLSPDGQYDEFRVPQSGESTAPYSFQPVVTTAALVNMGGIEPVEIYQALQRLHRDFPDLTHLNNGDGDTVNIETGVVQPDQLLPNQATSLITCWDIVKSGEPQVLFMSIVPSSIRDVYRDCPLW